MNPVQQDHVAIALGRLPQLQQSKPRLAGLLTSLLNPMNDLEQVFMDLIYLRALSSAVGHQLDRLGVIVGVKRNGLTDDQYRILISARIMVNISEGDPEMLIKIFQALTQAPFVVLQEYFPAGVGLFAASAPISQSEVDLIFGMMGQAVTAGVRVDAIGTFDTVSPFAFDGVIFPGAGFGDTGDAAVGGKLGRVYPTGPMFAFDGTDPTGAGFSTLADSLVGGRLVSL